MSAISPVNTEPWMSAELSAAAVELNKEIGDYNADFSQYEAAMQELKATDPAVAGKAAMGQVAKLQTRRRELMLRERDILARVLNEWAVAMVAGLEQAAEQMKPEVDALEAKHRETLTGMGLPPNGWGVTVDGVIAAIPPLLRLRRECQAFRNRAQEELANMGSIREYRQQFDGVLKSIRDALDAI